MLPHPEINREGRSDALPVAFGSGVGVGGAGGDSIQRTST